MIKLCKVLNFNKVTRVIVTIFNEIQIQFVTDRKDIGSYAYIKKDNDGYKIVDKSDYYDSIKVQKKQRKIIIKEVDIENSMETEKK